MWVAACNHSEPDSDLPTKTAFSAFNLIGYNTDTGATCYLQGKPSSFTGEDGKKYDEMHRPERPDLRDEINFRENYRLPRAAEKIGCTGCHTTDPWIVNQRIAAVFEPDTNQRFLRKNRKGAPMVVVNGWLLKETLGQSPELPRDAFTAQRLRPEIAPKCTNCHDIGGQFGCRELTRIAFDPLDTDNVSAKNYRRFLSPSLNTWHKQAWHASRLRNPAVSSFDEFRAAYGESYDAVLDCCSRSLDADCWEQHSLDEPPKGQGTCRQQ